MVCHSNKKYEHSTPLKIVNVDAVCTTFIFLIAQHGSDPFGWMILKVKPKITWIYHTNVVFKSKITEGFTEQFSLDVYE